METTKRAVIDQRQLRFEQLQAVYRVTEVISEAGSLEERYPKILEIVMKAVRTDRIAILVFDQHGVMRFKASIGLSEKYKQAVEGHSPWPADAKNPQPVLVEDVLIDPHWGPFLDIFRVEQIRSLAFIPLSSRGRLVGKFMLYYDSPHSFSKEELELGQGIASMVGFAIERHQNLEELNASSETIKTTLESITDAFYALDREWRFTYLNNRAAQLWGESKQDLIGRVIWEVFPSAVGSQAYEAHFCAMNEGTPVQLETASPILNKWIDLNIYPSSSGLSVYFRDIDERKRTQEALQEIQRRSIFLAQASNILASSLDYETTLQSVAELSVPELADLCTVHIVEEDGNIKALAVAHLAHNKAELGNLLKSHYPLPDALGPTKVIRTAEPDIFPEVSDLLLQSVALSEEHLAWMRSLNVQSYMCVPLVARGRTLGAISFVSLNSRRIYSNNDLVLARGLASRAALAVDNARLYQESRHAQQVISTQLKEKEILIKEIHHRVKNNLQIISSLLNLQATQNIAEPRELLKESQHRVRTMALIHEKLYQSDLSRLDLGDYIRDLASSLYSSFGSPKNQIDLKIQCETVLVDLDKAVPCGLIVNEIISNSLKHAFPQGRRGEIEVAFERQNGTFVLDIRDDGVGMSDSIDMTHEASLGLRLIAMLVKQLDGQVKVDRSGGTHFQITFS